MEHERPMSPWHEWKIVEKIGEGSFGKVYKAQRTEQGRVFYSALKIIPIPGSRGELKSIRMETSSEESAREYFRNLVDDCIKEVSTMESFRGNSHIVSVEDFKVVEYLDEIGWDIFIRMEYLKSFLDYCTGRTMTERQVIKLGIDICKALEYCGKLRIIHRDIKPENIFVSRFGDFKLGDFGIARELERSVGSMSKKGTFSYMAPEMYRGDPYDSSVDIYSLGIVLYKLMNRNRLPFMDLEKQLITYRDKELALNKRMNGELLPPPADASPELSEIILRACAYDVRERYQDPESMRVDLERLRRGEYIAGSPARLVGRHRDSGAFPFRDESHSSARRPGTGENAEGESGSEKQPIVSVQSIEPIVSEEEDFDAPRKEDTVSDKTMDQGELWAKLGYTTDVEKDFATPDQSMEGWQGSDAHTITLPVWGMVLIVIAALGFGCLGYFGYQWISGQLTLSQEGDSVPASEIRELEAYLTAGAAGASDEVTEVLQRIEKILSEKDEYTVKQTDGVSTLYYDKKEKLKLAVLFPEQSSSGKWEEYYYFKEKPIAGYIWDNSDGFLLLYNSEGELIRKVDQEDSVEDGPLDNPEYTALGETYWEIASKQLE